MYARNADYVNSSRSFKHRVRAFETIEADLKAHRCAIK